MDPEERVPRIGEIKIKVRPEYYLQRAHQEQTNGNDVLAIENYVNYMENLSNHDEMKLSEQVNLTKLVLNLGATLEAKDAEDEVMKCYIGILNHFPRNVLILNAFAVYLFSRGEYNVAKGYFHRAAAEGYLPAEKNLLHVLWNLIPRWHFRMLNDRKRNESYRDAMHKVLPSCGHVCDIGAGCGLLTLIAASFSKDIKVISYEENKVLFNIAQKVIARNELNNVTLCAQNSNYSNIAPCDLIVTEIFDAALFGENCLKSISHAIENLNQTEFKIIPSGAQLFVTGIQSDSIRRKTYYIETLNELGLEDICLSEINPEPYEVEYLKNETVKYITETKPFLRVNFYDKSQLEKLLAQDNDCCDEINLVCTEDGNLQSLAVWFDLNLDEEITISTSPFADNVKCWEQAIFHIKHPLPVMKNDILRIKPKVSNGQISFEVLNHEEKCQQCFEANKEIITFLNERNLVQSITQLVDSYRNYNLKIVDFNTFPLFGFLMAKKGATVYHVYKDVDDLNLFNYLIEVNQLCSYKFICIYEKAVEDYMIFLEPPDVIYTDLIKTDGSWNKVELTVDVEAKLQCETIPKKIFLKAQLIRSDYLDICNKVDESRALNFKISEYLNEFSGTEHPNLESFKYEECSSVVSFNISDLEVMDFHAETEISKDETVNAIIYWFDLHFTNDNSIIFSTLNSTHYHKTCTLLNSPKFVKSGDKLTLHVLREDGHLKIYCD